MGYCKENMPRAIIKLIKSADGIFLISNDYKLAECCPIWCWLHTSIVFCQKSQEVVYTCVTYTDLVANHLHFLMFATFPDSDKYRSGNSRLTDFQIFHCSPCLSNSNTIELGLLQTSLYFSNSQQMQSSYRQFSGQLYPHNGPRRLHAVLHSQYYSNSEELHVFMQLSLIF